MNNQTRAIPRTIHNVPHVWEMKRCKNLSKNCIVCHSSINFFSLYEKCQSCKLAVHIDCRVRVNNNCGLTPKHLKEILTQMIILKGQDNWAPDIVNSRSMNGIYESEDGSSTQEEYSTNTLPAEKLNRKAWNMFSLKNNVKWKEEMIIPFEEVKITSSIGRGRFGEVFRGYHLEITHIAIKFLNMNHVLNEAKRIEAFKRDTAQIQSVRHENLTFFLGYIIDRSYGPGIMMELIEGRPLSVLLHDDDVAPHFRLDYNDVIDIAKQICQGMSYLHKRGFLHKDLRSSNILIKEKEKFVKITDFGVFNIRRLSYPKRQYSFLTPPNWLFYLAPELIRNLNEALDPLPFSECSDIYSFGTIWYELMTNNFPFSSSSSECIIWKVGNGLKPPLSDATLCHEAKQILMACWSYKPTKRLSFLQLLQLLDGIPRPTIRFNPPRPAYKSFESMF